MAVESADTIVPFLLFVGEQHGKAEAAINFYVSLFPDSAITHIERFGPDEHEREGTIKQARFTLHGREHRAMESGLGHAFTFTPALSLFVTCTTEPELARLYEKLSADGAVLMPLDNYPFSRKYAWVQDRFGVSWQLNLP
jgi:predicted 3-demethylubiquinone-9 3-methyltransferase (glyoxalase superfamily)